jgi:nucleotide-binding universal stress UspA family protein
MHNALDGELHVLITYTVKRVAGSMININEVVEKNTKEDLAAALESFHAKIKTGASIKQVAIAGDAATVITSYAKKHDMQVVVMGTQGSNSLRTLLFGSVTRKVTQSSDVPVVAVPDEAVGSHFNGNVLLALDDKDIDNLDILDPLVNMVAATGQLINVVHVDTEKDGFKNQSILDKIESNLGTVEIREGQDPVVTLKRLAKETDVSLLAMIRRQRSFVQKLFVQDTTSAELAQIQVPLMILPETVS